jgi:hypothetical protein
VWCVTGEVRFRVKSHKGKDTVYMCIRDALLFIACPSLLLSLVAWCGRVG